MLNTGIVFLRRTLKRFGWVVLGFGLLVVLALQAPAPLAQAQTLSVDSLLRADGTLDLTRGVSGSLDLQGWKVTLDPGRGPVLARANAAPESLDTWFAPAHRGLNGRVWSMAVFQDNVYVGGEFTQTTDGGMVNLNHIARYDGANWSALPGNGLDGDVFALKVWNNALYAGGRFFGTANGSVLNLNAIAKFDGVNWSALPGNGLNNQVQALEVWNNALYVGGFFQTTATGSLTALFVAKFDGSAWSALPGTGVDNFVSAFAATDDALYVGGAFGQSADGTFGNLNHIAKFDGSKWVSLPGKGLNFEVLSMAWQTDPAGGHGTLYVGGRFSGTANGAVPGLNFVTKFDGTNWSGLPGDGLGDDVYALQLIGTTLYAAGAFEKTHDGGLTTLHNIAQFDGSNWSALPDNGLNNNMYALALYKGNLYVGGSASASAGGSVLDMNNIARLSLATPQTGPTYVVNTSADTDDGACDQRGQGGGNKDCTLREAILAANAQGGANTILFDRELGITVNPTLPTITDDLTISGGQYTVLLDGNNAHRILRVDSAASLIVNRLTFLHGLADSGLAWGISGGAIYNEGALNVRNSAFISNRGASVGGAIVGQGPTFISNSTFVDNQTTDVDSIGGAIFSDNTLEVFNSTFSANVASGGGASIWTQGTFRLHNSIFADSTGQDCSLAGTLVSESNNLMEGSGGCLVANGVHGDKVGVESGLGAASNHGGVTFTMELPTSSPALDAGDPTMCNVAPTNALDQRGFARASGALCDMGAFEKTNADCGGSELAARPTLLKPTQNQSMSKTKVAFDWTDAVCATSYKITVKNTTTHTKVTKTVTVSKVKMTLAHGNEKWSVQACNANGCSKSGTGKFKN